jgi:DNA-binding FadR family transcriptional regulator
MARTGIERRDDLRLGRGVHGRLVDTLGRGIVGGDYEAGETLDLEALQAQHEVSKTALREALRVLGAKGLVEPRQKRGTIVPPQSAWNLLDPDVLRWQVDGQAGPEMLDALAEVRLIAEPPAARLAALRRSDADLAALSGALEAMVHAADRPWEHAAADVAFHRALLTASGNELLARIGAVFEALLRARDELVHAAASRDDFRAPHAAVLDAIRERRPEQAHAAMLDLLAQSRSDALTVAGAGVAR